MERHANTDLFRERLKDKQLVHGRKSARDTYIAGQPWHDQSQKKMVTAPRFGSCTTTLTQARQACLSLSDHLLDPCFFFFFSFLFFSPPPFCPHIFSFPFFPPPKTTAQNRKNGLEEKQKKGKENVGKSFGKFWKKKKKKTGKKTNKINWKKVAAYVMCIWYACEPQQSLQSSLTYYLPNN